MSKSKLTGVPTTAEKKRIRTKRPVGSAVLKKPMANGARSVYKPDQDSSNVVMVDGEKRRGYNHVNENYVPIITALSELPKDEHYAHGEERMIYDAGAGTLKLIKFQRTGTGPADGRWWAFGTSNTILVW